MSCLKSTAGHILIEYESRVWLDSIENPYWKITVFFVIQRQLAVPRCAGNDGLHLRPQWIYTLSFGSQKITESWKELEKQWDFEWYQLYFHVMYIYRLSPFAEFVPRMHKIKQSTFDFLGKKE